MCGKLLLLISVVLVLSMAGAVQAGEFYDDFNTPHDYRADGVAGTGWDDFVGLGAGETVDALNADINHPGELYLESTGARWEPGWDPLGPFLYKVVYGDFIATVKVTDFAGCPLPQVLHNDCGIMARVPELEAAGPGEDAMTVQYFATWSGNIYRIIDDGSESELGATGDGCSAAQYLQLERIGNDFYCRISDNNANWVDLGPPVERSDMDGLGVQVGLWQCTYNTTTGYAAFDNFSLAWELYLHARNPDPIDEAPDVPVDADLRWASGAWAGSHDVYIGIDFNDVNDANTTNHSNVDYYSVDEPYCEPGTLESGRRYYWRVDEVNEPNIWKGEVWSFTTFTNTFEDFEKYTDSNNLNQSWVPGGSATASLSTDIYHSGAQSMRLDYTNSPDPCYAQASYTVNQSRDWTDFNLRSVSIYFRGQASNDAEKMYLIIEDDDWGTSTTKVGYDGDPNNLKKEYWQRWDIDLQQLVDENPVFRLSSIKKFTIGFGNPENPSVGGSGAVYFDDIALKQIRCVDKNRPIADFDGDCDVDTDDFKYLVDRWLGTDYGADLIEDRSIDFKDYTVVADKWLGEYENWPLALEQDEFLEPVPFYNVNITGGLWAERKETDRTVTIPHIMQKLEDERRIDNLRIAAGLMSGSYYGYVFNDSDVYKTIEAVGYSLKLHPDAALEATVDDIIDIIEAAQWGDGYLNSYYTINNPGARWTNIANNHELYCAGHLFEGAVAYYEATGKDKILNVSIDFAEHILDEFGPGKNMHPPGHQEVELALIKMYHLLGDERYLDITKFFIDERGNAEGHSLYGTYSQDHKPLVEQEKGVGHAVRACYFFTGVAGVARENLDQDYMKAMMRVWDNIVSAKTYIIGGLGQPGGPEGFTVDYDLGNNSYCETCASIAFSDWNHRMFLLTGDGKYLDIMERSMLNNILSGLSLSGDHFFYPNRLESGGTTRPDWYECACCPPNLAQYIMSIGEKAYAHNDEAIYVNTYINGDTQIPLAANTVNLSVDTNYPWDGGIEITVTPSQAGSFPIYLRIPSWARNIPMPGNLYGYLDESSEQPALEVNGSPVDINIEKGFAKIERFWTAGDTIHLVLPMPVRKVIAHPLVTADAGLVAIQRGPVVYCAEGVDNGGSVSGISIPDSLEFTATYELTTLNGVTVLRSTSPNITLVPYYTWANRGSSPMKVWLPREP